jgi:predicted SnoaL-like aldol condensation-catalyzing enzyme
VPIRVFQDDDFVFAQTEYDFFGPKIGFDIFRFEEGLIVEHWDSPGGGATVSTMVISIDGQTS